MDGTRDDMPVDAWTEWLREKNTPPAVPVAQGAQPERVDRSHAFSDPASGWVVLPLTITTVTPVVVPTGVKGSSVETARYLPERTHSPAV